MHNYYSEQTQNHYYTKAIIRAKRKQENYLKRLCLLLVFSLVVGSFYLWDNRPQSLSSDKAILALSILWLSFVPSLQYLLDRNRPPMPFLALMGIFYANSFALPIFSNEKLGIGRWSQQYISTQSLQLTLLGLFGMIITFYVSKFTLWRKVYFFKLPTYSLTQLIGPLRVLVVLHIVFSYLIKIPSIDQISDTIGNISYGIFYIIWSRGQLSSLPTKLIVGSCFIFEIIMRFSGGSLANLGFLGTFMAIVIFYERKKLPILLITSLLALFLIFNVVKAEYRQLTWYDGPYSQASPLEKAQLFIDIAVKHYSNPEIQSRKQEPGKSSTASALSRTAHIILFSNVIADTPRLVPYWNGESYSGVFAKFIPRILWPNKPQESIGNVFGRRYRYISIKDYSTTFNLPLIVEMYANFGTSGVQIGMSLLGLLFALLEKMLNSPRMGTLEVVIGVGILYSFTSHEWNFSLMFGNVFTVTLFIYFMFKFILLQQQRQ